MLNNYFSQIPKNNNLINVRFNSEVSNADLKSIDISNADGKNTIFKNCDFSYSELVNCYFHQAQFINCKFVGSKIKNSNFRSCEFSGCDFKYSNFEKTILPIEQIFANLPDWPNVRKDLLKNLYINAKEIGDFSILNDIVKEELKSEKEHWRRARKKFDSYYNQKYKGIKNFFIIRYKSFILWIDSLLWGHGEFPLKLFVSCVCFNILMSFLLFLLNLNVIQSFDIREILNRLYNTILYVLAIFIDYPNNVNISNRIIFIDVIIILARYIYFGLLINIIFRKFSKR